MNGCMKRLSLGILALWVCLSTAGAAAKTLTITRNWTTLRAGPSSHAPAVALAFGNDRLPVARRSAEWIAVRAPGGRELWVPAADTDAEAAQGSTGAAAPTVTAVSEAVLPMP